MGQVERHHQTLYGQVRAMREHLRTHYKRTDINDDVLLPWAVKHATWVLTRFARHTDGKTSYFRRWGKDYKSPVIAFGESVQYMLRKGQVTNKLQPRFADGIWVGRDTSSNEHMVLTSVGLVLTRTIRRLVEEHRYNGDLLEVVKGTPRDPFARGKTDTSLIRTPEVHRRLEQGHDHVIPMDNAT